MISTESYGGGWIKDALRVKNSRNTTEAGLRHCTTGTCGYNSFRSEKLGYIRGFENLGLGAKVALASLYGSCGAINPLTSIPKETRSSPSYINRAGATTLVSKKSEANPSKDIIFMGSEITKKYSRLRNINPQTPPHGIYESQIRSAGVCRGSNNAKYPKVFGLGASARFNPATGRVGMSFCNNANNFTSALQKAFACGLAPKSSPGLAIDCAEFIGMSAIGGCMKLSPNQRFGSGGKIYLGSEQLNVKGLRENLCLKNPKISPEAPMQTGDIFNINGTHSIVITEVGRLKKQSMHPFGKNFENRNCNAISSKDFNFSFAQSTTYRQAGPMQMTTDALVSMEVRDNPGRSFRDPFPLNKILIMARNMCKRAKEGATNAKVSSLGAPVKQLRPNAREAACKLPQNPDGTCKVKLEESECAESCGVGV